MAKDVTAFIATRVVQHVGEAVPNDFLAGAGNDDVGRWSQFGMQNSSRISSAVTAIGCPSAQLDSVAIAASRGASSGVKDRSVTVTWGEQ